MSDKNIDKDIEVEKRLRKSINVIEEMLIMSRDLREEEFYKLIGIKQIQAIADIVVLLDKRCKTINDLKIELETYKKIAERLAILLFKGLEGRYICDVIEKEHCNKYTSDKCIQCIIDWTRNEVRKMYDDRVMCKYDMRERCTHTLALCNSCYIYKEIKKKEVKKDE